MTSPSKAFDSAIHGINNFMTSPKKTAALTYNRNSAPTQPQKVQTVARPLNLPAGTVIGAPSTSQSKALQAKK